MTGILAPIPKPAPRSGHAILGRVCARGLALAWLLTLLFAGLAQAATTWIVLERNLNVLPAFGSVGLTVSPTYPGWAVLPITDLGVEGGVPVGSLISVDGRSVGARSPGIVAGWLRGDEGGRVSVVIGGDGMPDRTIVLTRTESNAAIMRAEFAPTYTAAAQIVNLLVAMILIGAAAMLRWRRSEFQVAWAFSFAFLMLATVGCVPLWALLDVPVVNNIVDAVWISLFLMAVPALPTGRYVPRWTRWAVVLGPILGLALINMRLEMLQTEAIRLAMLSAALACVILRFAYTPAGAERQQMKWASLGLTLGLVMFSASILLSFAGTGYTTLAFELGTRLAEIGAVLHRLSFVVMAAGVVVCLLDYRLNDADAAVGRSAGYALLTTLIAVVWAVGGAWINKGIGLITGDGDPTLSTALSTLIALSLLAPAQSRIMRWTEARFQRALVRLRSLPDRLSAWRHGDDPKPLARSALASIVNGVNADQAAVVLVDGVGGVEVLAAHNVPASIVIAELAETEGDGDLGLFTMTFPLGDEDGRRGYLLLGRRSDGSSYSRDERSAVAAVLGPLSIAISVTSLRARHKAELLGLIASVEGRMAGIEARRVAAEPAAT